MINVGGEPRKLKLHKTSVKLIKKFLEPLQTKSPLDQMKISPARIERSCLKLSHISLKPSRCSKSPIIKPDSPTKILNLPKLPFGTHVSYNNSQNFVQSHFVKNEKEASDLQISEIKQQEKHERIKRKLSMTRQTSISSPKSPRISQLYPKFQELAGSGGKLVIEFSESGVRNYLAQKSQYSNKNFSLSPQQNSPRPSAGKLLPFFIL